MLGHHLVRCLEDDWRGALDAVARRRGWPTSHDVSPLGSLVSALSAAYNDPARAKATMRDAGAARLVFAFPRDVPKAAAAVRELVATGTLRLDARLRVLDVGAGLGAMTWGVVRALAASGARGIVEATWTDVDAQALEVGRALLREAPRCGSVELRVETARAPLDALARGPFDVVILGNVLTELDVGEAAVERVERHTAFLRSLLDVVDRHGSLVVVEPALRDRARHLHRVRDRLATLGARIFAPCLHVDACPMLARESDWCHEDLAVDLPGWLVPVARAAGLRRQGLTLSYLVLRRDDASVGDAAPVGPGAVRLRVVSEAMPTKGKLESFVCGDLSKGSLRAVRTRVARLDRDRSASNAEWDRIERGDLILLEPAPDPNRPRIAKETSVSIASRQGGPRESR